MQLSKLELKGFKSFADKTVINFNEGITGIVGPNGCGKSNVVDSIRWVLGEQKTRMLRSEKLENIIFNGAKSRKATQLAEVSLSFNNTKNILPTEYSEVTITRRYYRSGDSEYLLNGVPCRLKDITNLFLDTGISSNSYAIIELKMVDDILNDKDNSRRSLFEEAAGISKFKQRKKETLRKLNDADADLERVEDLLFEIDKNMKSLERQARQAEKYQKLKDDYKNTSIALARHSSKKHQEAFDRLQDQIQAENDKKLKLSTGIQEKEAEIEKLKKSLIEHEQLLSQSQKTLNSHVGKIRQYESDKQIKNERLRYLQDKSDSLEDQITQDKQSKERADFAIKSLIKEKDNAERALEDIRSKLAGLRNDHEEQKQKTQHLQEEVQSLDQLVRNKQTEVYNLTKSIEVKEIQVNTFKQELEKTATDTHQRSISLVEFEKKTQELEKDLSTKNKALSDLKDKEGRLEVRIKDTEKTVEVLRDETSDLKRKIDSRQNEFNLTKSMIDNLEGFPEAIKFLKKESGWGKKVPLLSDIIACPDEYRVTIENYLDPYMNYYVVESVEDAYKAVEILSDAAKGKANFFVVKTLEKYSSTPTRIYDNAFPASEVVEYDSKYRKLISFILDNVYIVDGDYHTVPKDDDATFITRNGKVTKRRHSISGGSVGLFEGKKIGRIKNLEKLEKELKKLTRQLETVEQSYHEKQQELVELKSSTHRDSIDTLQQAISTVNEEYISIKTKQEQFSDMLSRADLKKEDFVKSIETHTKELTKLRPAEEEGKKELSELSNKLEELSEELRKQSDVLSEKSSAFNQENIFFHQQENRVQSIEQELGFKKTSLASSDERIKKNQEELKSNELEIKQLIENSASQDEDLIGMYNEKEKFESEVNEAEKNFYTVRGQIDETEKGQRELQRNRENIDSLLMELQNTRNDVKLELAAVRERILAEFNLELTDLEQENPDLPEGDEDSLRDKVSKLRDRIENMGPVNPMAMEAYQEIQERFEFITKEKQDLEKAKESLLTTIDEIDTVAKATFLEAFEMIKTNFVKVFRSLFTDEDDCELKLSNPAEPLESSIEIMAKPKGKKPLSISQLSGGEKTLTAISLLFAIYLIKPAPFCIFDEVDAPLDDANIDKFNNIIRKFSEDSQFILVTHNKRTMASTDVIYGITMIEQGVSKVVPVDLRELV